MTHQQLSWVTNLLNVQQRDLRNKRIIMYDNLNKLHIDYINP